MVNEDLLFRSARALATAIRAKEISPLELLDATLARADEVNDRLNAVIWRNDDEARAQARAATAALARPGGAELPFTGSLFRSRT